MKRLFDLLIAVSLLIITSPIIIFISFILLASSGSPIVFKHKRPGLKAKPFYIYKFRTMNNKCDENGELLSDAERLTKVGAFIRKTSLDELPQLINVIKGELSLVGPRPLCMEYLPLYNKEQARRHDVKPGITGWAQINGRNNISWEEKFELDIWYVNNHSFLLDLKIFMLTFIKVLRSEGVSKDGHATTEDFRGSPIEYTILQSVKQKKSIIGVVDLGETGLPLANKLVSNGFKVIGFDLDEKRVKKINKGKSYVSTVSDKALSDAVKRRKFRAFKDFRFLSKADIIVICIPLALKERKTFFQITRKVSKYLRKNQLVCIETIVPPKTTNKCMKTLIPSDLQADKDFFLAYTPLCLFNNEKTKIIGGVGETSTKFAKEFYDLNNYLTSTVSSTTTAEVINIYNHIYLTVQRGLRNEFEMIGDRFRIKPLELSFMNEVKEDYTLIESDLHYLINKLSKNSPRRYNLYQMVTLATNMNNNRLFHIRRKVINLLKKDKIQFREANILVLGVTNNNQKDRTALNLIQLLIKDKINVQYYDKQLPKLRYKNNFLLSSINIAKENFQTYDLVVVMSIDHEIDYKRMAKLSRRILLANNGLGVLKNNQLSKK